jgi:hypothetical protein
MPMYTYTDLTVYETQQQMFLINVFIRACKTVNIPIFSSVLPHVV